MSSDAFTAALAVLGVLFIVLGLIGFASSWKNRG